MDAMSKLLREVEFRQGLRGYNMEEVDEFLERMALEAETFDSRLAEANGRIAALKKEIEERPVQTVTVEAPVPVVDEESLTDSMSKALLLAQRTADTVVAEANEEARALIAAAEQRSRELEAGARLRAEAELQRLQGARASLQEEVAQLVRLLESERNELAGSLAHMAEWVRGHLGSERLHAILESASSPGDTAPPQGPPTDAEREAGVRAGEDVAEPAEVPAGARAVDGTGPTMPAQGPIPGMGVSTGVQPASVGAEQLGGEHAGSNPASGNAGPDGTNEAFLTRGLAASPDREERAVVQVAGSANGMGAPRRD